MASVVVDAVVCPLLLFAELTRDSEKGTLDFMCSVAFHARAKHCTIGNGRVWPEICSAMVCNLRKKALSAKFRKHALFELEFHRWKRYKHTHTHTHAHRGIMAQPLYACVSHHVGIREYTEAPKDTKLICKFTVRLSTHYRSLYRLKNKNVAVGKLMTP